ncbi:RluA family pseudouridine synthase [Patescibacteria group bacterium]|nr:RluA family pseudouridine synthase [Patescibacteria group bacterium]
MKELIFSENQKQRLDKFLAEKLPDFSRSQIQKLIKTDQIKVNDQSSSVHHWLKVDDKIIIDLQPETKEKTQPLIEPRIIEQNDNYLIIDKPAGLIVHPAEGIQEPTLVDWLTEKFPQIKNIGENKNRPGIIHRLDKEVSGIIIIALNQKMFDHLKQQFKERKIKKEYLALIHGLTSKEEGVIDFPLDRSKDSGKIIAKPQGDDGKKSITNFLVLKKFSRYTYLQITILTGRTHQIRVHLQAYGHPLVGDHLYYNKKIKDNLKLNRIFLHAHLLGFYDLQSNWLEFKTDLPSDLTNILTKLK